jgi:hypothetical protein
MAAVSSPPVSGDSAAAVRGFLQCAIALYQDVFALHHDADGDEQNDSSTTDGPSTAGQRLAVHAAALGDSLEALRAVQPGPDEVDAHPLSTLPGACFKVAQDLMLHLDRVTGELQSNAAFDAISLRDLWSLRDVAALGTRLQALSKKFHDDVDNTFE